MTWLVLGFFLLRFLATLANWLWQPRLGYREGEDAPFVSILVPARNEAKNLPHLLREVAGMRYSRYELVVLDDHSEDETAAILQRAVLSDERIRYLPGKPLPPGWLGKNWACHQLAQVARGQYFLFLDADIAELSPQLLPRTLAEMRARRLSLLSIFPDQLMESWGERLVVPIMHYLLLSLLPLWWILRLPFPSMAAANGQFMLFEGAAYRAARWHERVKSVIVEDIAIMQQVKAARQRGMTFVASGLIHCRMYHGFWGGIQGFSKNILAGFGNSKLGLLAYLFLISAGWVFPLMSLPVSYWPLLLAGVLAIRAMISQLAAQPSGINLILHPAQIATLVATGLFSIYKQFSGKNEWKGRNLQLPQPSSSSSSSTS
jgi:glycosyltransferase involved in cell wall biosynthesis